MRFSPTSLARKSSPLNPLKPETAPSARDAKKSQATFDRLRRHFLAGIFVIIPAFVAVYAVLFIVGFTDNLFGKPLEYPVRAILEHSGEPVTVFTCP